VDDLAAARQFVEVHGLMTPRMLWDHTGASWAALGVASQPAALIFDRTGHLVTGWIGEFDTSAVLDVVARL
jgi:hypothetical protein